VFVNFRWNPGFSVTQKQKNVAALHEAAAREGIRYVLEVSTKSNLPLGRALSAFNLQVGVAPGETAPIELAYQASKVFELGGPYEDLLATSPAAAKRDERLRSSGKLVRFHFGGKDFPLQPMTAFYDWLYLRAIVRHPELLSAICLFQGFTDIEFNPERSVNCQARSCATAVSLARRDELKKAARSFAFFCTLLGGSPGQQTEHELLA
jgi:hypothetical protein